MLKRGIIVAGLGKIQSGLTHQYAKIRGGVTDTSEYTAGGVSRTVYWFRNDSKRMGDYSPLGSLMMNEQAKEDFSKKVVDTVFLHEVGHDQMGSIGNPFLGYIADLGTAPHRRNHNITEYPFEGSQICTVNHDAPCLHSIRNRDISRSWHTFHLGLLGR
jgi:hypothetical protein